MIKEISLSEYEILVAAKKSSVKQRMQRIQKEIRIMIHREFTDDEINLNEYLKNAMGW